MLGPVAKPEFAGEPSADTERLIRNSFAEAGLHIHPMQAADAPAAVVLISLAMNPEEGRYAKETFDFHFDCLAHGINDGRDYYTLVNGDALIGLVGLHWYSWGPAENVWLSWFALDPGWYGKGLGRKMLDAIGQLAAAKGYRKFFIETYSTPEFAHARRLYEAAGFVEAGGVRHYLPDSGDMVVYYKPLSPST